MNANNQNATWADFWTTARIQSFVKGLKGYAFGVREIRECFSAAHVYGPKALEDVVDTIVASGIKLPAKDAAAWRTFMSRSRKSAAKPTHTVSVTEVSENGETYLDFAVIPFKPRAAGQGRRPNPIAAKVAAAVAKSAAQLKAEKEKVVAEQTRTIRAENQAERHARLAERWESMLRALGATDRILRMDANDGAAAIRAAILKASAPTVPVAPSKRRNRKAA
jgi:hypothetical protein